MIAFFLQRKIVNPRTIFVPRIDQSQNNILRELVELSKDDESTVRVCAVHTVARLVEQSSQQSAASRLILLPLVKSFLDRDDDLQSPESLALSAEFGLVAVELMC